MEMSWPINDTIRYRADAHILTLHYEHDPVVDFDAASSGLLTMQEGLADFDC